jgi:hypothetical protein
VYPLALREITGHVTSDTVWRIDSVSPPIKGGSEFWRITYTSRDKGDKEDYHMEMQLDPGHRFWVAHSTTEGHGKRTELDREFRRIGGAEMPWSVSGRTTFDNSVETYRVQFHEMSHAERDKLKHEVERIIKSGPSQPNQTLKRSLWAIALLVPISGACLLCLKRGGTPHS